MTQEQIAAEVKSIGDNLTQVLANSANAKSDAMEAKAVAAELKSKLDGVVARRLPLAKPLKANLSQRPWKKNSPTWVTSKEKLSAMAVY